MNVNYGVEEEKSLKVLLHLKQKKNKRGKTDSKINMENCVCKMWKINHL